MLEMMCSLGIFVWGVDRGGFAVVAKVSGCGRVSEEGLNWLKGLKRRGGYATPLHA